MITYFNTRSGENMLRGMLHKGKKKIPIIIVHGFFSSNKIGPYRLYFQLADYLNRKGYTVLRMDFSAMGESDGNDYQITFDTHIADLCNVINSLMEIENAKKVHVIAHCVGCCTSLQCLYRVSPYIASLTLVAPFIPTSSNLKYLLGETGYTQLLNNSTIYHKGMYCDKSFITASNTINNNSLITIAKEIKLKVFFAENDQLSPLADGQSWASANNIDYETISNADHNFLNLFARKQLFYMISKYLDTLILK